MFSKKLSHNARVVLVFAICALCAVEATPALASVCTLADHIKSANSNTAVGFCPAGTGHDVITITEDITLSAALPAIRGTITIEGGGHTISGGKKFPIFFVDGGRLTINNLTLIEGHSEATEATRWFAGGALRILDGAEVNVNHSIFSMNSSGRHGGAITVARSKLTVNNSSFIKNRASGNGGAIALWSSTSVISNSSFVGNVTRRVQVGGAISVESDVTLNVINSTFNDNYAGRGGAVATNIWRPGGSVSSRTTLTHVTMVDNRSATEEGLNIWVDENDSNFKLRNSLVAGTKGKNRKHGSSCQGPLNENIGNLIEDGSCASMAGGDPMLAEMTGSPAYIAILDGSPALDSADARFCPETDQLGTPRPQGAGCDIGAFESTTAIPSPTAVPGICPLPDQIIAANSDTAVGNCPAGNGADIIHLIRDFTLSAKLPPITSEITIEGNGYTISGDDKFGIIEVDGGALTISNLTLTQGNGVQGWRFAAAEWGPSHRRERCLRYEQGVFRWRDCDGKQQQQAGRQQQQLCGQ